ncbi:uncharacterized protein isoform X4 [Choristoneura fumiferana]|uniref:uncharacterized protein isoform X4 n=1 Tax=Choristoneura fumiferana TaxID=7141 RepID=UPI003D158735
MPCCVMRKCHNNTRRCKKADGIGYHKFPSKVDTRKKWIRLVQIDRGDDYWLPLSDSRVCSAHFNASDTYFSEKGRCLLKKESLPIVEGYIPPDDAVPSTSEEPVALVTLSTSGTRSPPQIQVERLTHTTTATTSSSANEMETLVIKTEEDDEDDEEMPLYTSDRHGTFSCMTQTSPIPEAGAPFDFKQPGPSDSSEILRLKHLLEEKSTVIYKQAKKIEMLDHEVNRLLARNQYLEDLLKESGISYED